MSEKNKTSPAVKESRESSVAVVLSIGNLKELLRVAEKVAAGYGVGMGDSDCLIYKVETNENGMGNIKAVRAAGSRKFFNPSNLMNDGSLMPARSAAVYAGSHVSGSLDDNNNDN